MNDGDNLGPRGLSSLNKTGWEALNKSRASNTEQLTVVKSSPNDIYQNVTGITSNLVYHLHTELIINYVYKLLLQIVNDFFIEDVYVVNLSYQVGLGQPYGSEYGL